MLPAATSRVIASRYLPSRYYYWYARSKLASDPLYSGVLGLLRDTHAPVLDVGCGIGLLAQALGERPDPPDYFGVDFDAPKIDIARAAARAGSLQKTRFEVCDLLQGLPAHQGSVLMLDVLQYFEPHIRDELLSNAARSLGEDGCLILRTGIDDGGWRAAFTRVTDKVQHTIRWMKSAPRSQPTRQAIADLLSHHGLASEFQPPSSRTPFNNWLVKCGRGRPGVISG